MTMLCLINFKVGYDVINIKIVDVIDLGILRKNKMAARNV